MPVDAVGFLTKQLDHLKASLAACSVFQEVVDAADAAAASAHIHDGGADENDAAQAKPRAIIRHADEMDIERMSTTHFEVNGALLLIFEFPVPAELLAAPYKDQYRDFCNKVGAIIGQLSNVPRQAGYLNITGFEQGPLGKCDSAEENGDEFFVSIWVVRHK